MALASEDVRWNDEMVRPSAGRLAMAGMMKYDESGRAIESTNRFQRGSRWRVEHFLKAKAPQPQMLRRNHSRLASQTL